MRGYQVAWTHSKMIYSWVRNSATSDAACPLWARQRDKFPCQEGSMRNSKSSSTVPAAPSNATLTHTCTHYAQRMQEATESSSHVFTCPCVCVCRNEAGPCNNFEALGCHEQLDPKDSQDSEDPREYCYGTVESLNSLHHQQMYSFTAARVTTLLS